MAARVTSQEVGTYYDQMAHYYHLVWEGNLHVGYWTPDAPNATFREAQENLTNILISQTPVGPGKRVLDVGCGLGRPGVLLAEKTGCEVVGISISQAQVTEANRYAKERGVDNRVSFQLIDAMHIPFEAESFDAAWAFECLFHMPDRAEVLRQMSHVLRPGSRLNLTDSFEKAPFTPVEKELVYGGYQVNEFMTPDEYRTLFATLGFDVKKLVDISENTANTQKYVMLSAAQKIAELTPVYGDQFMEQMEAAGKILEETNRDKIGYFWLSAEKRAV